MWLEQLRRTILLFVLAVLMLAASVEVYASANVGDKAPDFKLQSITGKSITLDELRQDPSRKGVKRPVVLVFWATWCPPCRAETPILQALHEKYKSKGLLIVGASIDRGGLDDVKPFVNEHKLTYTILVDPDDQVAGPLYAVRGIPMICVLDRNGVIRKKYLGSHPGIEKDLDKDINAVLK
jgi:peroxiredoxin